MFLFYHTTLVALFVSLTNGFNRLFNHQLVKKTKRHTPTTNFSLPLQYEKDITTRMLRSMFFRYT